MPYRISGTKSETARVMIFKKSDWSIESNTVVSGSGAYEIDSLVIGNKIVIARFMEGRVLAYGDITPIDYSFERTILNPATEKAGSLFGQPLAATDTYLVIGANWQESVPEQEIRSGQVHMYNPTTGVLQGTIENPNNSGTKQGDAFGYSVALTDTCLLVGATEEEGNGVVYKFNPATRALLVPWRHPGNGTAEYWDPEITGRGRFGFAVDISPNSSYAIVGDPYILGPESMGTLYQREEAGKAFIINVSNGEVLHILDNPEDPPERRDKFGYAVAINNTYAVVGMPQDEKQFAAEGVIYIYNVTTGELLWSILSPRQDDQRHAFGKTVSINDNNKIIVGAPKAKIDGQSWVGEAYIYDAVTGNLLHTLYNPSPYDSYGYFGVSVDISNTHIVIGAHYVSHIDNRASPGGTEWLFEYDFADLTNLSSRIYTEGFYNCVYAASDLGMGDALNDSDYQQYVMHDIINDKYYTMDWSSWGHDDGGSFAYTRQQVHATTGASIGVPVVFSHGGIDDPSSETDLVDTGLEITRDSSYGIFNRLSENDEYRDPWSDETGKAHVFDVATGVLLYTFDSPYGRLIGGRLGSFATINSTRAFVTMPYLFEELEEVHSYTL